MQYRERPVPALDRWVECVWSLQTNQELRSYPVLPDGCIDIVYSPSSRLEVIGAMTRARRFHLPAQTLTVGVRFRPGMASTLLRIPAQELTDRSVALEDLWGSPARALESRLSECNSADHACQILTGALACPDWQPTHTQRAVEAITAGHGKSDMPSLISLTGITERQFRRRLLMETGLTPKKLCRVLRFRRACALGSLGLPWSLVALDAGYFDQAHLIRDFREFAGTTPMSVSSNTNHAPFSYSASHEDHHRSDR